MFKLRAEERIDFPHRPFSLTHALGSYELLSLTGLREAAEALPSEMIEISDSSLGLSAPAPAPCGIETVALIDEIESRRAWVMLRNLEQLAPYRELAEEVRLSLQRSFPWVLEGADRFMCFAFISSPGILTPLHIDPEHNFLLQISGSKQVSLSDPTERRLPTEAQLRKFFADEVGFRLAGDREWEPYLREHDLRSGGGVFIPHLAPHSVRNGNSVSVSFSFTFRSAITDQARALYRPTDRTRDCA